MKTTIEINGKLYDAKTGKVISSTSDKTLSKKPVNPVKHSGAVMDGVSVKKSPQAPTPSIPEKPKPVLSKQYAQDIKRPKPVSPSHTNNHNAVKSAQKSQTLNRKVVKKPQVGQKPSVHAKSATPNTTMHSRVEHSATGRGMLIKRIPETRLTRAMSAPKSTLVTKFGRNSKKPQLLPGLTVKSAPETQTSKKSSANLDKPVNTIDSSVTKSVAKKSVFEDHLMKANSHKQKPHNKEARHKKVIRKLRISPKAASLTAGAFAILLLGGFFAYQNVPSIGMRIAANKAGFSGKIPGSVPAGYAFKGPISASENNIVLTYESRSDDRSFMVKQKPSDWSSESLLNNYLLDSQFRYQVYRDKGLTVYIYNGSNATWVDKGVWYNVNSSGGETLSSEQLLEIASSI